MKRKSGISLLTIITLVILGCEKEVPLTSDEKTLNSLIGTWRIEYVNGYGLLEINNDHSFKQKTYYVGTNNYEHLLEIDEGTFKILNDKFVIESAKMTHFSDINNGTTEKVTYLYINNALELNNNKLKLSAIKEFKPTGENFYESIFGKWECSSALLLVFDSLSEEMYLNGIYTEIIELPANSSEYYYQGILKYDNIVWNADLFQNSYNYSDNIFSVNEFDFNAIVSFDNGNMIWQCNPVTYTKQ